MTYFKPRYLLLAVALLLIGCGGSGIGCSGCASSCGGNPNYKFKGNLAQDSVQMRLTQGGVDFITQRLKPIIEAQLKNAGQSLACNTAGVTFPTQSLGNGPKVNGKAVAPSGSNCGISVTGFPPKAACRGRTPSSTWFFAALQQSSLCGNLNTNAVKINLQESDNSVNVDFMMPEIRIRSKAPDIGFCYKGSVSIIPGDICAGAKASLNEVQLVLTQLEVKLKLKFVTDANTGKVGLKLDKIDFGSSTRFSVKLDGCKSITIPINIPVINRTVNIKLGGGLCTTVLKGIEGLINATSFLQPLIFNVLEGVIRDQFKSLDLLADAKMEMELPLSGLLGGLLPGLGQTTPIGMLMQPGKALGVVNQGLTLGMDSGFEATEINPCVPKRPEPQTQAGPVPALAGTYHMAAALSRPATNRALWAAYHSGVLCLKIRSSDLGGLGGGLTLNAGVLSLLAPDLSKVVSQDAPVLIAIQPTQPPDATFGTGKKINGKTDSTIKLRIPDFGISFYVLVHDRYVRIFRMLLDADLGISLVTSPTNELEIAIDTDAIELKNARTTYANLVKINDPNSLLKLIVSLLTQTLGSGGISFPVDISPQLTAALGVPITLKINDVGKEGAAGDWLALKMTLSDKAMPLLPSPKTFAQLYDPPGLFRRVGKKIVPTGEAKVIVPQYLGPHALEYQYKVDFGVWSSFHPAPLGVLRVRHHFLTVLGQHKIWIRARIKGDYRTREEQPVLVKVNFDPLAPVVSLKPQQDSLQITAKDQVTSLGELRYAYKYKGEWIPMNGPNLPLTKELIGAGTIPVRVLDKAGNARILHYSTKDKAVTQNSTVQASQIEPKSNTALSCSTSPTAPEMPFLMLLGLLALGCFRTRTRR